MIEIEKQEQRDIQAVDVSVMNIKNCEDIISMWEGRLNLLNNKVFYYRRKDRYNGIFGHLKSIELEINKHLKQLEIFEKFINFEKY